tara:strand:+ start:15091 stop:23652 length:8562 start_codon:yes stop_codon:yes gene_type:complete
VSDLNPFMQAVGTVNEDLRNPFEAAAADLVNGEKAQLSSSMQLAKTGSADDHARALKASQKTGIPVDVVKTDLKQVEQDIEEHEFDYDALYQETPKTASFLMNPDNAGIAHDDVDSLTAFEKAAQTLNTKEANIFNEAGAVLEKQTAYPALLAVMYGVTDIETVAEYYADRSRALSNAQQNQPLYMQRFMNRFENAESFAGKAAVALTSPRAIGRTAFTQSPNSILPLASGYAFGKVGAAGGATVGSLVPGAGTASGAVVGGVGGFGFGAFAGGSFVEIAAYADQKLNEYGVDQTDPQQLIEFFNNPENAEAISELRAEAERKGITTAAVDAAFSLVGGRFLSAGRSGAKKAGDTAADIGVESVGEGTAEAAGQYAATGEVDAGDVILETAAGVGQSTGTAFIQGANRQGKDAVKIVGDEIKSLIKRSAQDVNAAERGNMLMDMFAGLSERVKQSKLKDRSPEKLKEHVRNSLAGTDAETVYVDSDKFTEYFQSRGDDPALIAEQLGILQQYEDAQESGGDLLMSHEEALVSLTQLDAYDDLSADMRVSPADMTYNEAQAFNEESQLILEDYIVHAREQADRALSEATSEDRIYEDVYNQLINTGMTPDVASKQATLHQAFYASQAKRNGMDAYKLYSGREFKIQRELPDSLKMPINELDFFVDRLKKYANGKLKLGTDNSPTLLEFIKSTGGINDNDQLAGDLIGQDIDRDAQGQLYQKTKRAIKENDTANQQDLFNPGNKKQGEGRFLDDIALDAWEKGYFPELQERPDTSTLVEAIKDELKGNARRSDQSYIDEAKPYDDALQLASELGLDIDKSTNKQIKDALFNAIETEAQQSEQSQQGLDTDDLIDKISDTEEEAQALKEKVSKVEKEEAETPEFKAEKKPAPIEQQERIDDFGEVLHGARKHEFEKFKDALSQDLPEDPSDITISKYFPIPNYEELNKAANGDIDYERIATLKAIRDNLPSKPKRYQKSWAEAIALYRELANKILDGELGLYAAQAELNKHDKHYTHLSKNVRKMILAADLYKKLGYPYYMNAKGYSLEDAMFSVYQGVKHDKPVRKHIVKMPKRFPEYFDTEQEALDFMRLKLEVEAKGGNKKKTRLDIYQVTKSGEIIIGKKVASNKYIDLKSGFKSLKEARLYLSDNEDALLVILEEKKKVPPQRRSTNDPRIGEDYRKGESITPDKFAQEFGFRGVQFGNYVEQGRRQKDLNNAYDALLDLANIIDVPARAISLNGTLGLAFGARGKGGINSAAAHYEPDNKVINLTKKHGAGSLGHEWWHALDHNIGERQEGGKYLSDNPILRKFSRKTGKEITDFPIRPEVVDAYKDLMKALVRETEIYKRSKELDKKRTKDYWSTDIEVSARAFESYLRHKAKQNNESNDYLANVFDNKKSQESDEYAYLTDEEMEKVAPYFDKIFQTFKTRETSEGVEFYQSGKKNIFKPKKDQANRYRESLKALEDGTANIGREIVIGDTPEVYKMLGANPYSMRINGSKIKRMLNKHEISYKTLEQLPEALADPIMVLDSSSQDKSFVVLTELLDEAGNSVMAAIHLDKSGEGAVLINKIASVYGKDDAGQFIRWIKQGKMLYADKKKALQWSRSNRLQLPKEVTATRHNKIIRKENLKNNKIFNQDVQGADNKGKYISFESAYNSEKRGSIKFSDNTATITLTEKADLSTFLHESGHMFLETFMNLASNDRAPDDIKRDRDILLKWMNVKSINDIGVEQHEQFARGFEAYLFEGKAPSIGLQSAFDRFKAWLMRIYKSIKSLDVNLTDEVRGVMDRMLATDEEIKYAQENLQFVPDSSIEELLNKTEQKEYRKLGEKATLEAREKALKESMKDIAREQKAWWKDEKAAVRKDVEDQVNQSPVFRAIHFLQKGKYLDRDTPEGIKPVKLSKKILIDRYGEESLKSLPRPYVYSNKGGTSPEVIAEMFDFSSADELMNALWNSEKREDVINRITNDRMKERHGDMLNDGSLEEEALNAVYNDERAKVIAMEMRAIARQLGGDMPAIDALKEAARATISRMPTNDAAKFSRYHHATRKAAREAGKALGAKDYETAVEWKRKELLNHFIFMEARDASKDIDKILKHMSKYKKQTVRQKIEVGFMDQIDAILDRFEFSKSATLKDAKQSLSDFIAMREKEGEIVSATDFVRSGRGVSYKIMPMEELRGLYDTIRNLDKLGRLERDYKLEGQKIDAYDAVEAMVNSIEDLNKTKLITKTFKNLGDKTKEFVTGIDKELTRMEFIMKALDGNELQGVVQSILFQPFVEAQAQSEKFSRDVHDRLKVIFEANPNVKKWETVYKDEKLGVDFKIKNIITIALNMGNASNYQKLLDGGVKGQSWTEEDIQRIVSKLTKDDWDTVQSIWDLFEELRPGLENTFKEMTNLNMDVVEPTPVQTPYGVYNGGYMPLVYDREVTYEGSRNLEGVSILDDNFNIPSVNKGMTQTRSDFVAPLELNFDDILLTHLGKTIHFITHGNVIRKANRLIIHPMFKKAVLETAGVDTYNQFRPWLQSVAKNSVYDAPVGFVDKFFRHLRTGVTTVFLGFSHGTIMKQTLGITTTQAAISRGEATQKNFYKAIRSYISAPGKASQFVFENSLEMQGRLNNVNADLTNVIKATERGHGVMNDLQRVGMMGIAYSQVYTVDIPTWFTGYYEGMDRFNDKDRAVAYADALVRQTQGSGAVKDLAKIQRGSEAQKTVSTMFGTYILGVLYPRLRELGIDARQHKKWGRAAITIIPLLIMPAMLEALMSGEPPEDDETYAEWVATKTLLYGTSAVPFFGSTVRAATSDYYGSGFQLSPIESVVNMGINGIKDLEDGEIDRAFFKGMAASSGLILKLPTYHPYKTIEEILLLAE